jgi:hypothetical protein
MRPQKSENYILGQVGKIYNNRLILKFIEKRPRYKHSNMTLKEFQNFITKVYIKLLKNQLKDTKFIDTLRTEFRDKQEKEKNG